MTDHINALSQQLCVLDVRLGEKHASLQQARDNIASLEKQAAADAENTIQLADELCRAELQQEMLQSRLQAATQQAGMLESEALLQAVRAMAGQSCTASTLAG